VGQPAPFRALVPALPPFHTPYRRASRLRRQLGSPCSCGGSQCRLRVREEVDARVANDGQDQAETVPWGTATPRIRKSARLSVALNPRLATLSRIVLEPVTEPIARHSAALLAEAGVHGHTYAIDAMLCATSLAAPGPGTELTSDPEDLTPCAADASPSSRPDPPPERRPDAQRRGSRDHRRAPPAHIKAQSRAFQMRPAETSWNGPVLGLAGRGLGARPTSSRARSLLSAIHVGVALMSTRAGGSGVAGG
jgi:hypothetical protein